MIISDVVFLGLLESVGKALLVTKSKVAKAPISWRVLPEHWNRDLNSSNFSVDVALVVWIINPYRDSIYIFFFQLPG